ncbi:ubiquinol-cytochrome-c reductase complex assembly factor 2-like [Mercenaria mercenaria]|uniref:ubiquinol-cytochrome-c reductase complex assembly factor 2-like n=1 Tax=Mercenaria mercenaria TaxID=6596 RepID=UPI001E1DBBDF|nr:ubiquinol-cytochrome-c reductase complex assembly factor 2-like [Mercenaria mercenaria]
MSAARYRQALRILERWPTDPSKGEHRDIGILLRQRIGASFKNGEQTEISDPKKCDKMLSSLDNISVDKYRKQYSFTPELKVGALLMEPEECQYFTSEEGVQYLRQEEEQGVLQRTYTKWFGSKTEDTEEKKVVS